MLVLQTYCAGGAGNERPNGVFLGQERESAEEQRGHARAKWERGQSSSPQNGRVGLSDIRYTEDS